MSILEKLIFDELLEAVAPFLNAAQEALPQVPNPLPSREAPPLVPDQNPFPVEDISPEPDLDSVKEVLRNRLIIHRLGQKGRTVSDDEITLILDRKDKILSRMFELDSNPFWNQRRHTLIRDYMLPPRGGEFKISVLEGKLEQLLGENATSSSIYKELIRARDYFHIDGRFRGPRGN